MELLSLGFKDESKSEFREPITIVIITVLRIKLLSVSHRSNGEIFIFEIFSRNYLKEIFAEFRFGRHPSIFLFFLFFFN